jgi:hypothetical protein
VSRARTRLALVIAVVVLAVAAVFIGRDLRGTKTSPPTPKGDVTWTSGVFPGNGIDAAAAKTFGGYRGCPVQIASVFTGAKSWQQLASEDWYVTRYKGFSGRLSIGLPLTFAGTSLGAVSTGVGDAAFTAFAQHLKELGRGDSDIRLGWEFNGDWYSWSAFNPSQFNGAFRHVAGLLKKLLPSATIDWNGNLGSSQSGHNPFTELYPGNDVVDVIGVDAYDNHYANADSTAGFTAWAHSRFGLDEWYAFAKQHGKKFSLPEWGLNATGEGDNPAFIRGMYQWLRQHSSGMSYESYFNWSKGSVKDSLHDPVQMPAASRAYAALWKGGPACRSTSAAD